MKWFQQFLERRRMDADLSKEMQHLEEKIEAFVAQGMPREEAIHVDSIRHKLGGSHEVSIRKLIQWVDPDRRGEDEKLHLYVDRFP